VGSPQLFLGTPVGLLEQDFCVWMRCCSRRSANSVKSLKPYSRIQAADAFNMTQ